MKKKINVGVVGFGTVGAGVVECLLRNAELIGERTGVLPVLKRVADLDITSDRGVTVGPDILTTDLDKVLDARDIDVVVELIGGTTVARDVVLRAIGNGKPVVTANKALLAACGEEIFSASQASSADVYFEASVGGGIPIIKAMREGLVGNRIQEIVAILNGTCNYILTRMEREEAAFDGILGDAQANGYAESDPSLDIDGIDTAHKAAILASLAHGRWFAYDAMHVEGIRGIDLQDVAYAAGLGYRIKLLAVIKQESAGVQARVHPTLVPMDSMLANVDGVYNALLVKGDTVGNTMYYGRGAGREATASAVVADIVDVGLNLKFGSHRRVEAFRRQSNAVRILPMAEINGRYYLRLQVVDRPNVLAVIAGVLGRSSISIASVTQKEGENRNSVPIVILTHEAREADMQAALLELRGLAEVSERPVMYRVEDLD
jgi:homoserine dehydrogenase